MRTLKSPSGRGGRTKDSQIAVTGGSPTVQNPGGHRVLADAYNLLSAHDLVTPPNVKGGGRHDQRMCNAGTMQRPLAYGRSPPSQCMQYTLLEQSLQLTATSECKQDDESLTSCRKILPPLYAEQAPFHVFCLRYDEMHNDLSLPSRS